MSVFQTNIEIASHAVLPVPSDSQVPGLARGAARPAQIRADTFLDGGPDLAAAVDQAIFHGNGTASVPQLNEEITGSANLKIERDRYEEIKGVTHSVQQGGVHSKYGESIVGGKPFTVFAYSSVYEGLVSTYNFSQQSEHVAGTSDSIEFGNRSVYRSDYETRTTYGADSSYTYGQIFSQFKGIGKEEWVVGSKHDTYDQVTKFEGATPLNLLLGTGLHLQCRPGAELNYNIWNVVVAISESLVGLVNLEPFVARLAGRPVNYGLSGARLSADAGNIRYILGIPIGNMRIP